MKKAVLVVVGAGLALGVGCSSDEQKARDSGIDMRPDRSGVDRGTTGDRGIDSRYVAEGGAPDSRSLDVPYREDVVGADLHLSDSVSSDSVSPDSVSPDSTSPDSTSPDLGPPRCIVGLHGETYLRSDGAAVNFRFNPHKVVEIGDTGETLTGLEQVFEGQNHGCGRHKDGSVWCWAKSSAGNSVGQLGKGKLDSVVLPWQANQVLRASANGNIPLSNVRQISSGSSRCYSSYTTCAVTTGGEAWCWGHPHSGGGGELLLNDSSTGSRTLAVPIMADANNALDGVEQVSLGGRHACALRTGGEVWCWGANVGGPLGQGDQTTRKYPVKVPLPAAASMVGAGADLTCALVSDGVYCWGSNNSGQVGIGEPNLNTDGCINFCKRTPARVIDGAGKALDGVKALNVAYLAVCAKRQDDSLWCWGAQTSNVAAPLSIAGAPIVDVDLFSSCSSSKISVALRYLNNDGDLRRQLQTIPQVCP